MEKRRSRFALSLLAALVVGLLGWRALKPSAAPKPSPAPALDSRVPAPSAKRKRSAAPRSPVRPGAARPDCEPYASESCHDGDVWSLDSCGAPHEKLEECENRMCRDDLCEEPAGEPCDYPPEGRCDGDTVRACQAGRPLQVDCAAEGLRCVYGDEGAECAPPVPAAQRCSGSRVRCDGEVLVGCAQGQLSRTSCAQLGARCLELPGGASARCVALRLPDVTGAGCGPCGCAPDPGSAEHDCDGRDDDGDGLIDEGLDCGPVPIIAFVVTDSAGRSSHAREDIEAELAKATRLFGREPPESGLSFTLEELIFLADPTLLDLDDREIDGLATDPRLHPPRPAFYVPVVFTDRILAAGKVPKLGISTLPNGSCGGMQMGHGPEVGLVAVSKARSPTTVVHELGHFLGLCHTHGQERGSAAAVGLAMLDPRSGALSSCRASCRDEGDGLCDTPFDPGPPHCAYDIACQASCGSGDAPDATNLMSYYTECRSRFSDEQMAMMQHTLALRRGWHRCFAEGCGCGLSAEDCPAGMTCRPFELEGGQRATRCALDGARHPGAECTQPAECGRGSICLADAQRGVQRCVRPCSASAANCQCVAAGDALSICLQDLGG